jgi:hypothetical protein
MLEIATHLFAAGLLSGCASMGSMRATFAQSQRPLRASNTLLSTSLRLHRTNALCSVRTMFGGHVKGAGWSPH